MTNTYTQNISKTGSKIPPGLEMFQIAEALGEDS